MKLNAAPAVALWGVFLGILTLSGILFFGTDAETPALLGGAAALVLTAGFVLGLRGLGRPDLGPRGVPSTSPPTAWLALAIALLALSPELGYWLALIAGGMIGLGVGGLIRELAAQRRATGFAPRRVRR